MELRTAEFYAWERRGRGWMEWSYPVELEPPFRPLARVGASTNPSARIDDGRRPTPFSRLTDEVLRSLTRWGRRGALAEEDDSPEPEPEAWWGHADLYEFSVAVPPTLEVTRELGEQLLLAFPRTLGPVAFELVGSGHRVQSLVTVGAEDAGIVTQAIRTHAPDAVVSKEPELLTRLWSRVTAGTLEIAELGLGAEFMVPLRTPARSEVDPLAGVVTALAELSESEVGAFQVLFTRVRAPWAAAAMDAVLDDEGSPFFIDSPDVSRQAREKVGKPLYAALIRLAVKAAPERARATARSIVAAFNTLSDPLGNELVPLAGDADSAALLEEDLLRRRTHRSGAILSLEELATIAHLPSRSVRDARLVRFSRRTRPAPTGVRNGLCLGMNEHEGQQIEVRLSAEQRARHMHLIGASGTGKSTLLLQMIRQDLEAGQGFAVLDPHGDLVDRAIGLIPDSRRDDVILLDPGDPEYAVGFNVLSAVSDTEKAVLGPDLVALFQRLATSWGDQMTAVLANALQAIVESERGGTLLDLRRFLVEAKFRTAVLATVRDPDVRYYWEREFPLLRGHPQASILTRLDAFLRPKAIRHMVGQRDGTLDLRRVMEDGGILLCRLAHGSIGEDNAYLLGTLLVSKLHQVALGRQDQVEQHRRPFTLYVDEFHHFVTPSMASILSGARKYRLGLVLAHQDLRQLHGRSMDVHAAVLSNPCTRVCFRVGDDDAATLAKGFAHFDATDLQSLGVGEAIARIERADQDFNLATEPLPEVAPERFEALHDHVVAATRARFGARRGDVEGKLWPEEEPHASPPPPTTSVPVTEPTPATTPRRAPSASIHPTTAPAVEAEPIHPVVPPTPTPGRGRGGPQHTYLQELIRRWADANGWRATLEEEVLDGLGRVDVALRKGELSVACEIAVSSPVEHEVHNIQKCLAAGFSYVTVVCSEKRRLSAIRASARSSMCEPDLDRVLFCSPEEAFSRLSALKAAGTPQEMSTRGYRVRVRGPGERSVRRPERESAVSAVIARAIRRVGRRARPGE